uniref:Uncharacterized protein n=2 Tax=Thalassionema nitzschioides TaxID=33649 RepID=A0A7S1H2F8_9STRA|mmetsp:Transcript_2652/g.2253  ORF Transcript_2652/g.2253 Transcript_2652/m.2253 type:complete len:104 (+) Transcript_2652:93-404(+)
MGGGPKPEWTGIDATVRSVFPEDWQLAAAIMGGYTTLYLLSTLASGKKKAPPAAAAPSSASAAPSTGVPSVNSPEFENYIESDAFEKMLNSEDQLSAWLADDK